MSEYVQLPERSLLGKKIVLCGLSEAGKTSIRDVVFGGKEATEVEGYGATLNYVRQFISLEGEGGYKFTLMDLGGQRIFLDRFITKFSPFVFHNVVALIYVVDVADSDRFNSAKHYFDAALERLQKYSPKSHVFVLIHKMDLVEKNPDYKEKITDHLRSLFEKDIDRKIIFFETTIYNETIKNALYEILKISFPEIPTKTTQPPREIPSEVAQQKTVSEAASFSIETPQPIGTKPQVDIEAAPSPAVEVNLSEIARALAFIEQPFKIPYTSEQEVGAAIPVSSQSAITEELPDEYENIVKALQFIETGVPSLEDNFIPKTQLEESKKVPELPVEELREPSEDITSIEIAINDILSEDEIKELIPDLEEPTPSQAAPENIIFPKTAFESHSTLDEEFDVFIAAEEIVRFLDETRMLFNLFYLAVKLSDAENLVHVGDFEKYDELACTTFEIFQMQTESDPTELTRFIMRAEKSFILIEPIGDALNMLVIGPLVSKSIFLSKLLEFKEKMTRMLNITFYDMF
ncbi:MAG: ADP-ribosylation factor-like protein [Candidatus Heimdallarchaeota archaeon]